MGKKGLSRDEKLQKVQELLHESKTAMTLKELEQKCYKDKGVVANTVKDIAQELVSDNLVCCEKIGLSNYYWSFPSQALVVRRTKEAALGEAIATKKRRRDELVAEQEQLESTRVDDEETARSEKLQKLAALRDEEAKHEATLRNLQINDPALIAAIEQDIKEAKLAAERWTDAIMEMKKLFCEKTNAPEEQFDQAFETGGIDYMD